MSNAFGISSEREDAGKSKNAFSLLKALEILRPDYQA